MEQIPDFFRYRDIVLADQMPDLTDFPKVAEQPVFVRFREHHCIDPEIPVPTGSLPGDLGDNVQNAYLPYPFNYRHVGNTLRVEIPGTRTAVKYEDYVEGKPNSHNPRTCGMCIASQEDEERQLRARIDSYHERAARGEDMAVDDNEDEDAMDEDTAPHSRRGSTSSQDSDVDPYFGDESNPLYLRDLRMERDLEAEAIADELMSEGVPDDYEEYIENECNGIQDILITGEVRRSCIPCPILVAHLRFRSDSVGPPAPRRGVAPLPLLRPRPQVGRSHRPRPHSDGPADEHEADLPGLPDRQQELCRIVAHVQREPKRYPARGTVCAQPHRSPARSSR